MLLSLWRRLLFSFAISVYFSIWLLEADPSLTQIQTLLLEIPLKELWAEGLLDVKNCLDFAESLFLQLVHFESPFLFK